MEGQEGISPNLIKASKGFNDAEHHLLSSLEKIDKHRKIQRKVVLETNIACEQGHWRSSVRQRQTQSYLASAVPGMDRRAH